MNNHFAQATFRSPLKEGSRIRPFGNSIKKTIVGTLALTSLIDAFTILVIYLVVSSGPGESLDIEAGINLPSATLSKELDQSPLVTYRQGHFYIDDKAVADTDLKNQLQNLRERTQNLFKKGESSILVQADENVPFEKLQPIMVASAYAGIRHVKFAVLQKD